VKLRSSLLFLVALCGPLFAQQNPNYSPNTKSVNWLALVNCANDGSQTDVWVVGFGWQCVNIAGSAGGTVTNVSSGDASPLFSVTIANPTSTPAFTFTQSNATDDTIFGNFSGSLAQPTFNSMSACGDSTHALGWVTSAGFSCQSIPGTGGTVTNVSSGNLSPLFSVAVSNQTTTPAFTFTQSNASANTVFGNFTASPALAVYNSVSACGDGTHALSWILGTGFACQAITGSGGTVTTLSVGNLSPLFSSSVANPSTTPSVTFTQTNAGSNTVFGNFTGSGALAVYNAISACGDGNHALSWVAGTGFACQDIALPNLLTYTSAANTVATSTSYLVTNTIPVTFTGTASSSTVPTFTFDNSCTLSKVQYCQYVGGTLDTVADVVTFHIVLGGNGNAIGAQLSDTAATLALNTPRNHCTTVTTSDSITAGTSYVLQADTPSSFGTTPTSVYWTGRLYCKQ
jgi:hypothetical protein